MTLRTRIRKIIKWTAMATAAAFLVCWIGSNWYYVELVLPHWSIACRNGEIRTHLVQSAAFPIKSGLSFERAEDGSPAEWWFYFGEIETGYNSIRIICVPIWVPLLAAAGISLTAWNLDRIAALRARNNCCNKCGYQRAGLKPDALCPECGV